MTDALSMFADLTYDRVATTPEEALAEAIRRVGGRAALARSLAISTQAVRRWRIAPVRHALEIEKLTGISRHDLRSDVYPHALPAENISEENARLRAIVDALRGKLADLMVENATLTARLAEETYKVTK